MSRIGKKPINLPSGVTIDKQQSVVSVKGPKGNLQLDTFNRIELESTGSVVSVKLSQDSQPAYWGLYRTLIDNMVIGVSEGFKKQLELHGTGYRASVSGKNLALVVGFSHPVTVEPLPGIQFEVDKTGKIHISGSDKATVGQMAASIRSIRPPEPYHGKGIRYAQEVIVTKQGKSSGKK